MTLKECEEALFGDPDGADELEVFMAECRERYLDTLLNEDLESPFLTLP